MSEWLLLGASALLVVACGGFVAAEFALVAVDRPSVEAAVADGDRSAAGVQAALRSLSTQLSAAQVGITVTNLAIGFLAEPAIAALLESPLVGAGVEPDDVRAVAFGVALLLATTATMVFGELVPKNLAIARPLATARRTQLFLRLFSRLNALPIRLLNGTANALVRRLGVEPQEELRSARNVQELASLIDRSASEGTLDPDTAGLMQRSVAFGDRTAGEIMTPRMQMVTLHPRQAAAAVVEHARTSGRSRFPVVSGEADDAVGAIHVKHVLAVPREDRRTTKVRDLMVEPLLVPESLRLDPLLALLRQDGFHLAVVLDEYGGTAGVVTLEDVVEEIVGDISDEHDQVGAQARRRGEGSWSLSGLLRPDEVEELTGVRLPVHEDYDTVAGLFLQRHGRIPVVDDRVTVALVPDVGSDGEVLGGHEAVLVVERMVGMRVDRLRLEPGSAAGPAPGPGRGRPTAGDPGERRG